MRALLSAVGTRGDVQPIVALAVTLRELGHTVRLCVPPNFVAWAQGLGFEAHPVGVEMRAPPASLDSLRDALRDVHVPEVATRARSLATQLRSDGTVVAAQALQ